MACIKATISSSAAQFHGHWVTAVGPACDNNNTTHFCEKVMEGKRAKPPKSLVSTQALLGSFTSHGTTAPWRYPWNLHVRNESVVQAAMAVVQQTAVPEVPWYYSPHPQGVAHLFAGSKSVVDRQ